MWEPEKYPSWLVFEVEGRLQIRPKQYLVASALTERKGTIAQLNMGEGKTRVLIPMLMLHWGKLNGDSIVRVHILSQLLIEAFDFFHQHLCASVLRRKVYMLPFNRDIDLTLDNAGTMLSVLNHCRRSGGLLLLAPEHRLSIFLKNLERQHEAGVASDEVCRQIQQIHELPYRDLFDESDEILRHEYQLIYAVGDREPLPSGQRRWHAAQALLHILKADTTGTVAQVLEPVAIWQRENNRGYFDSLRIIGDTLPDKIAAINVALAVVLLDEPPYEFRWMRKGGVDHPLQSKMINFITDPSVEGSSILVDKDLSSHEQMEDLLAFRGLLAHGLLAHCLSKRHRVDFGVARSKSKKRLAIPFRANDTPSERAEFAHPDCAIILTTIAYYITGLTQQELSETFKVLLELGENTKRDTYRKWFALCDEDVDGHLPAVDSVEKIDLSNEEQFKFMFKHYYKNMEVVNFWLNRCVFEVETMQYPHRLLATPWHLTDSSHPTGFSGTNDTQHLLPLHVTQRPLNIPEIDATNGKMLDLILDNPQYVCLGTSGDTPLYQNVLDYLRTSEAHALVDGGALMAGLSSDETATKLLEHLSVNQFSGVVFCNDGDWQIRDRRGVTCSLSGASIDVARTFVYYDESHCRGADMKLDPDAVAVVTVGPGMCKDKLMQAVGRMRQLDFGQSIVLVGYDEVTLKIAKAAQTSANEINSNHVLLWVMSNTVQSTIDGLVRWAYQGAHFCTTKSASPLLDDKVGLELYAHAVVERDRTEVIADDIKASVARAGGRICDAERTMLTQIQRKVERYGGESVIILTGIDEECERELETEIEIEQEIPDQVLAATPYREQDWDYESIYGADSALTVDPDAKVRPLSHWIEELMLPEELRDISWSDSVYCTTNFFHSIVIGNKKGAISDYIRMVDAFLLFPEEPQVLLVSEREADRVLGWLWEYGDNTVQLVHLTYLHQLQAGEQHPLEALHPELDHSSMEDWINPVLASMELFNGTVTFQGPALQEAVTSLVSGAQSAAKQLVHLRGLSHMLEHSDLDEICAPDLPSEVAKRAVEQAEGLGSFTVRGHASPECNGVYNRADSPDDHGFPWWRKDHRGAGVHGVHRSIADQCWQFRERNEFGVTLLISATFYSENGKIPLGYNSWKGYGGRGGGIGYHTDLQLAIVPFGGTIVAAGDVIGLESMADAGSLYELGCPTCKFVTLVNAKTRTIDCDVCDGSTFLVLEATLCEGVKYQPAMLSVVQRDHEVRAAKLEVEHERGRFKRLWEYASSLVKGYIIYCMESKRVVEVTKGVDPATSAEIGSVMYLGILEPRPVIEVRYVGEPSLGLQVEVKICLLNAFNVTTATVAQKINALKRDGIWCRKGKKVIYTVDDQKYTVLFDPGLDGKVRVRRASSGRGGLGGLGGSDLEVEAVLLLPDLDSDSTESTDWDRGCSCYNCGETGAATAATAQLMQLVSVHSACTQPLPDIPPGFVSTLCQGFSVLRLATYGIR
jgi:hypothetical protein